MSNRPIIGISGSHNMEDTLFAIRENYVNAVLRAGGIPVLLPETADRETVCALLDVIDGLLLSGGGDVRPAHFGEEPIPACGEPDDLRDAFELQIIPEAVKRQMPIFGVCRGIQVLAVALGGTLIQDIESQRGIPKAVHSQEPPYSEPVHTVRFEENGLFASITGVTSMRTNSMHHQAIKDPGEYLIVEGYAEDGIIEAVRGKEDDSILAVQFHPEFLAEHSEQAARIFGYFVEKADAYRIRTRA